MSKHNKVNKNNYDQAGRLSPDDMARERQKQTPRPPAPREEITNRGQQAPPRRGAPGSTRRQTESEESA